MEDESKWINLRKHPRIAWNFIVKFRPKDSPDSSWEVATLKDISKGGCFFHSSVPYEVGQILELLIRFPSLTYPMWFAGEVRRCESSEDKESAMYGIGVCFLEMEKEKKEEFIKTLNFFLKKQKKENE